MMGASFFRRRLLDLFCCEGGAAEGYKRAGFLVYGVDLFERNTQGRYPFASHKGDVVVVLTLLLAGEKIAFIHKDGRVERLGLEDFAAIHASPPCQPYSVATAGNTAARANYDRLIAVTRDLLQQTGKPWVIENVAQAKSEMVDPVLLCGRMFCLGAYDEDGLYLVLDRHRLFETNWGLEAPPHPPHDDRQVAGVYDGGRRAKVPKGTPLYVSAPMDRYAARVERGGGYAPRSKAVRGRLLGIDWMTGKGLEESIPPAYAEWVGVQLMAVL